MKNRKIRVPAAFVESKDGVFECRLRIYSFAPGALHKTLREGGVLPLLWRGESIGSVCMFEGADAGVRCVYRPAGGSKLAMEAVTCIRQGWVTGIQLEFDIMKYLPGRLKEVRLHGVTFVRTVAGFAVRLRGEECSKTITLENGFGTCYCSSSEGLRRADNRAERLKSLCGQPPDGVHRKPTEPMRGQMERSAFCRPAKTSHSIFSQSQIGAIFLWQHWKRNLPNCTVTSRHSLVGR